MILRFILWLKYKICMFLSELFVCYWSSYARSDQAYKYRGQRMQNVRAFKI